MSNRARAFFAVLWITALAAVGAGQFTPARPSFDRSGRPIATNVGDEGAWRVQTFHASWAVLAPRFDLETSELSISWERPREPRPGWIVFSGRIEVSGQGSEPTLGWYQGIAVLVSPKPLGSGTEPSSLPPDGWGSELGYAAPDGTFTVGIAASRLERTVGVATEHALALELARHRTIDARNGEVRWSRSPRPLAPTVVRCELPGPEPLVGELEWINAADTTDARHHDPARTLRCVNRLLGLGKEGALCALREYCEMALDFEGEASREPGSIDQSNFLRALPIAMLLFEPVEPGDAWNASPTWTRHREDFLGKDLRERWPHFPIVLAEDLPILVTEDLRSLGYGYWERAHLQRYLDWCEETCAIRAWPLRPPDDPLPALDRWMDDPHVIQFFVKQGNTTRYWENGMTRPYEGPDYRLILFQGLRLVLDGLPERVRMPLQSRLGDNLPGLYGRGGALWNRIEESVRSHTLCWDEEACRYVD